MRAALGSLAVHEPRKLIDAGTVTTATPVMRVRVCPRARISSWLAVTWRSLRVLAETRKPRLATAMVGTLGLLFGSIASFGAMSGVTAALTGTGLLFLISALWILLYVAKVGPESWHRPSLRQIERQRMRELKAATAEERAQTRALEQAQWAERRRQASEITGDAMNLAKRKLEQWNQK